MDYEDRALSDPQLRFHLAQVDKLPEAARNLIITIIKPMITFVDRMGKDSHSPD